MAKDTPVADLSGAYIPEQEWITLYGVNLSYPNSVWIIPTDPGGNQRPGYAIGERSSDQGGILDGNGFKPDMPGDWNFDVFQNPIRGHKSNPPDHPIGSVVVNVPG